MIHKVQRAPKRKQQCSTIDNIKQNIIHNYLYINIMIHKRNTLRKMPY